ncbi:glycosyltransferase family 2 protein [Agromyces sp. SYSU T00266]|uniref:glycosyltransferase family 2 protein n=1 Tax=Agromyces zhanjiangensis TaxID=3158562 RepID=UPI003399D851
MSGAADAAARPAARATTVSVVIGTHNGARFVGEQVATILGQTRPVDEIVVSDDASADDTIAIVERAVQEYRATGAAVDLLVLRNDVPLGVTANFEQALRAATGDVIALSDQDDLWHPDRIAVALAAFEERPSLCLVAGDAELVDAQGTAMPASLFDTLGIDEPLRASVDGAAAFDELLRRNLLTGATMMLRRELVELAAPFPASWVHDEWLAVVAAVSGGIGFRAERLIGYRQHGSNQIGVTSLDWGGRIDRLRAPRTERNGRLLARAGALADRLPGIAERAGGVAPEFVATVTGDKLAHERARSSLPAARVARIGPVLREWRTGRYTRYGLGAQDVLRDLVQPI